MEMLRNITAASAATSNPLLKSILGPDASEAEYKALAQQAESVWKMMDEMAENDPNAYKEFVRDAAKAAQEEVDKSRDPHVEGLAPALVLEAQAQQPSGPAASGVDVTRVMAGGQAVARVHVWAANDASGVKAPLSASGSVVSPQGPAPQNWSGLLVPIATYRPATTQPGTLPVHHFHVACHASAVRMCALGQPQVFRAVLLEAVSQFVEAEYRLQLSRTMRTLQVHRDAVTEAQLQELLQRQQEHQRACSGLGSLTDDAAGSAGGVGSASALPQGLLEELCSLGASTGKQPPGQWLAAGADPDRSGAQKAKKALIEELN